MCFYSWTGHVHPQKSFLASPSWTGWKMSLFRCFQFLVLLSLLPPSWFLSVGFSLRDGAVSFGDWCSKIIYYSEERKRAPDGSMCRRFAPTSIPSVRTGGWMYGSVGVRWLVGIDGWVVLISSIFWQVYPECNGNVTPFQLVLMVFASLLFALTAIWLLWLTGTATHPTAQVTFLKVKSMINVIKLSDKLMSEARFSVQTAADGWQRSLRQSQVGGMMERWTCWC